MEESLNMRNVLSILFAISLSAATVLFIIGITTSDNRFLLVAVSTLSLAMLLVLPVLARLPITLFDPFSLFTLYVLLGAVGNSYIIAFRDSPRRTALMNGNPLELFIWGGVWLAVAMFVVGLGYVSSRRRLRVERILPNDKYFTEAGLHLCALIGLVIALAATVVFIQQTGGINGLANLSRKRAIAVASGSEIVYASAGYLRLLSALPMMFLYMLLPVYLRRQKPMKLWQILFLLALLLAGVAIPFLSSSRSDIAYSLIGILFIVSVWRKLTVRFAITAGLIVLTAFSIMTGLRVYANVSVGNSDAAELSFQNPIIDLMESGNGMSLSGTTLIMDGVPERMDYKLGVTFFSWLVAPIPRSIWPGKPQISLGKEIKSNILQLPATKSGRPASIIAEGFINFGFIGFFALSYFLGYIMRLVSNSFLPILKDNIFTVSIYFTLFLNLPSLSNGSLSQATVRSLTDIFPLYLAVWVAILLSVRPAKRYFHSAVGQA